MSIVIRHEETFADEAITVSSAAKSLTAATYKPGGQVPPTRRAVITVEDAQIRFRTDGSAPTSSVGHIANIDDVIMLSNINDMSNFKAIRTTSTDAKIYVSYKR